MSFNRYLLKGVWLGFIGKFLLITNAILGIVYLVYVNLSDKYNIDDVGTIFYIQTHFLIFNMINLPVFLLLLSLMLSYFFKEEIQVKYSNLQKKTTDQAVIIFTHSVLYSIIFNIPFVILSFFLIIIDNQFNFSFFIICSFFIQIFGYYLSGNLLLLVYSITKHQGLSLLGVLLILIGPELIGKILGISGLHSLDEYVYLKHLESFNIYKDGIITSVIFLLISLIFSFVFLMVVAKKRVERI